MSELKNVLGEDVQLHQKQSEMGGECQFTLPTIHFQMMKYF